MWGSGRGRGGPWGWPDSPGCHTPGSPPGHRSRGPAADWPPWSGCPPEVIRVQYSDKLYSKSLKESFIHISLAWTSMFRDTCSHFSTGFSSFESLGYKVVVITLYHHFINHLGEVLCCAGNHAPTLLTLPRVVIQRQAGQGAGAQQTTQVLDLGHVLQCNVDKSLPDPERYWCRYI